MSYRRERSLLNYWPLPVVTLVLGWVLVDRMNDYQGRLHPTGFVIWCVFAWTTGLWLVAVLASVYVWVRDKFKKH